MEGFEPRARWCLGNNVIPFEGPSKYHLLDIKGGESKQEFLKLELGGQWSKSMGWLLEALGLKWMWWKTNCGRIQLLQEFQ